jgi:hypothetical protein
MENARNYIFVNYMRATEIETKGTMAAKKFRPSFFRHFKKIGVVHSLLSL